MAYPLPLANALANLSAHAEVLLEKQEPTDRLFEEATSSDISDLSDRLADSLEFELGRAEVLATYYEGGILGVFGVLTLFWIVLALQQRSRAASGASGRCARPRPPRYRCWRFPRPRRTRIRLRRRRRMPGRPADGRRSRRRAS